MIKNRLIYISVIVLILFGFTGCKTYYIPVDSFKEQFAEIDSASLQIVKTRGPMGEIVEYPANPMGYIK